MTSTIKASSPAPRSIDGNIMTIKATPFALLTKPPRWTLVCQSVAAVNLTLTELVA
jgi:hypothetical protein